MNRPLQRRSPPVAIWLAAVALTGAILGCVVLGILAWQSAAQVRLLQAQVATLQDERQAMEAQLTAVQSAATIMEDRLATLEANDPLQQLATLQAQIEAADDSLQFAALEASLAEIQAQVDLFQVTVDSQAARIAALDPQNGQQESEVLAETRLKVTPQRQSHNLSCESSAASMVAGYLGVPLSEAEVLAALPLNDNPHLGFRGNVDGPTGGIEDYGVYAGPITAILNSHGLSARPVVGGLSGIEAALGRGNPVIAWVTYNCLPGTPVEASANGQSFTLVPNQHVVVVTGYNADGVWANDPWEGQEDFYSTADFERALGYFGDMAIEVSTP